MDENRAHLLGCALRRTHEDTSAKINHATARSGERQDAALPAAAPVCAILEDDQPQIIARGDAELGEFVAKGLSPLVRKIQQELLALGEGQPLRRLLQHPTRSVADVRVLDGANLSGGSSWDCAVPWCGRVLPPLRNPLSNIDNRTISAVVRSTRPLL